MHVLGRPAGRHPISPCNMHAFVRPASATAPICVLFGSERERADDPALAEHAVGMKEALEKIREQIANVV